MLIMISSFFICKLRWWIFHIQLCIVQHSPYAGQGSSCSMCFMGEQAIYYGTVNFIHVEDQWYPDVIISHSSMSKCKEGTLIIKLGRGGLKNYAKLTFSDETPCKVKRFMWITWTLIRFTLKSSKTLCWRAAA